MKITDFAVIFILLFLPFGVIGDLRVQNQREVQRLEMKYTSALHTAVQDAGAVLSQNERQEREAGYGSDKFFRVDKEEALSTFLHTLFLNVGIDGDTVAQRALLDYIPVIVILDYDGYYTFASETYIDGDGQTAIGSKWSEKKPFAYADSVGNSVGFTLDNYVHAYDAQNHRWVEGFQKELQGQTGISLLNNPETFEQIRRSTIVHSVQEDLARLINLHNQKAARNGVAYRFTLPTIPQEEWYNTVDDVGLMAFIQGIPVGDRFYNNYGFGGGRVVRRQAIIGGLEPDTGMKYFYRDSCPAPFQARERFSDEKSAAAAGYFEFKCNNGLQ
ncbi:hypothetical protein [Paenibacillus brasilensis]|uniref:F0F1-type ATP synthase n=1 Tax=Paenibacillus brasilensis TaxID=128574 RepID=A0ABU0KYM3_9BACL|nr:hypothetical protein [Paenibacillus brasilensis]MDQ0493328.1 hypothetical protein [Paenibacillus brasilensis]